MQSKQPIKKLLEVEHSSKKALELGAFKSNTVQSHQQQRVSRW